MKKHISNFSGKNAKKMLFENTSPKEKNKVKILTSSHKNSGIKKGEIGEIFLIDKQDKKAFVLFFDVEGFCRIGESFNFDEFMVTEPFDDFSVWLDFLCEDKNAKTNNKKH